MTVGKDFGIPHPVSTALPGNQFHLLVEPASTFVMAHDRITSASEIASAKERRREKRMLTVPAIIALAVLLYCVFHGYIVSGVILAGLVGAAAFWVAAIIPAVIGTPVDPAAGQLTAAGVEEVKRALSVMNHGRYQWVGRSADFVGVFPDTGFVYYFGPATGYRHLVLLGRQTVREVRVSSSAQVSQTSTSTTRHGRRFAVAASHNVAVLSKGKSTTTHQTTTTSHINHVLEIQYQNEAGAAPAWLSVDFGADGRLAEDWRLMITQTAGLA